VVTILRQQTNRFGKGASGMVGKRAVTSWDYIEFIAARLPTLQILGERKPIAFNINPHYFLEEEYVKSIRSNFRSH